LRLAVENAGCFLFHEKVKRIGMTFTSTAAVFEAAKWHVEVTYEKAVYPRVARLKASCDPVCATQVARPQGSGQTVSTVVGALNHLVFFLKRRHAYHGAEYFLLHEG
jgi:hypothetical protein